MSLITKYLSVLLLLGVTCFVSCREDDEQPCVDANNPDCPNYDPCLGAMPVIADNILVIDSITTTFGDIAYSMPVDTLGKGTTVYLRPNEINTKASYEWQVGTDLRLFTDPIVDMNFTGFEGDVEVRLVTVVENDFDCLPAIETVDTSYYNFYIGALAIADFPVHGAFRGALESKPNEEFVIEIYRYEGSTSFSTRIRGFPLDCYGEEVYTRLSGGYDWFVTSHRFGDFRCRELTSVGRLRENDHRVLEVDYTYVDDNGNKVEEYFVGYRE